MADSSVPADPRLPARREQVIQRLCTLFAEDHLGEAELEARLDRAHRAVSVAELHALLDGFPEPAQPAPGVGRAPLPATADDVAPQQTVVAVMGGATRRGVWTVPMRLNVIAVMGGAELDFREARFGPGVSEVTVFALMGGAEIIVPPGVRVETNGIAIMGGFDHAGDGTEPGAPGGPTLRVGGLAVMGGVEVRVRLPGESARDAKRRIKNERAEARRLRSGG